MTITIASFVASSCIDGGRDYTIIVTDGSLTIRGTATLAYDEVNDAWNTSWANSPDMWLSSELLSHASEISDAINSI